MWEGLISLLTFSTVMGVASFLAGSLPLSFGLSQHHSRIISAIGTGLLIGTCLIIIIPEGIGTLYSSTELPGQPGPYDEVIFDKRNEHHDHEHDDPHAWIGVSLILGFIMMYLIDQIPRHAANLSFRRRPMHVSLADLSSGLHHAVPTATAEEGGRTINLEPSRSTATTIGLVIHAAADGVALAASSFISTASTGVVVFIALMIHKAPAAFGLTSVLLKQGLNKREARAHLIVFSLAAPVGAIATWILVNIIAGGRISGEQGTRFATGLLLLFSGGTFLYVAMHQMQEGTHGAHGSHESHDHASNAYANGQSFAAGQAGKNVGQAMEFRDTLLVAVGMLLPLLASFGHSH